MSGNHGDSSQSLSRKEPLVFLGGPFRNGMHEGSIPTHGHASTLWKIARLSQYHERRLAVHKRQYEGFWVPRRSFSSRALSTRRHPPPSCCECVRYVHTNVIQYLCVCMYIGMVERANRVTKQDRIWPWRKASVPFLQGRACTRSCRSEQNLLLLAAHFRATASAKAGRCSMHASVLHLLYSMGTNHMHVAPRGTAGIFRSAVQRPTCDAVEASYSQGPARLRTAACPNPSV